MTVVSRFPASWKTDVTVLRGGGYDEYGNPLPVTEIPLSGCLAAPRSTADPIDRSDLTEATAVLYRDHDAEFDFHSTDKVRFPETALLRGTWKVDGEPSRWPFGVEVPLRKVS